MFKHGAASVVIAKGEEVLVIACGKKHFQLIGGKAKQNETPVSTALREVAEETGLALDEGRLKQLGSAKQGLREHSFFLYKVKNAEQLNPTNQKVGLAWMPLQKLKSGKLFYWYQYKIALHAAIQVLYA